MGLTADSTFVTADSTLFTADNVADQSLCGSGRATEAINEVTLISSRGKLESYLLIILMGTAAAIATVDNRATGAPIQVHSSQIITANKGNALLTILNAYPNDIVAGWDNFAGFPIPPVFTQQQSTAALIPALTPYAAYDPAPDIIYSGFRRKPDFQVRPDFIKQSPFSFRNFDTNPPPVGDLTTFYRPKPYFAPAQLDAKANKGAWYITLVPQGPSPPPPPPDTGGIWPPPSTITDLPGRGAWELPGGKQALWVFGNGCYLMTVVTVASATGQATFKMKKVGTLLTNTGQVSIRDNGPGGYAVIVDGPYGYFYEIATQKFNRITDPDFLGADKVAFIDGWWIFNQPGTQTFYTNKPQYSITFDASYFALKDGATDKLVALMENKQELWLLGEKTSEVWYDAGGQYFAFQRIVSTMLQVGIAAAQSVARYSTGDSGLVWLARSERGQNVIVKTDSFNAVSITTPAVADAIASYTVVSDAFGYVYQEDGHEFYVLTFPTADKTWVYDFTTNFWHERASFDPYSGLYHRHRSNCFINFQNQRLVGDYQNGSVYQLTRSVYKDHIWPLVSLRRTPHVWDEGARERVFNISLQIEFSPGQGNQTGMGYDPHALLRLSRDGGTTWGQELARSMGRIGQYLNRVIWRRLGFARDTVFEVKVIDPVKRDIVGATLKNSNDG